MPENFSLPSNISNEDPGKTPNQQEPGQRFSPPPSNVFIRTSESDLEKIKSEGGAISGMPPPPAPPPPPPPPSPPPSDSFAYVPPAEQTPDTQPQPKPSIQPEPAFSDSEPSFAPEQPAGISEFPVTEPESPQKNKLLPFIVIGVLIIAVVALGYFYLWPKFFQAGPVVTTTTSTSIQTTTTTLAASPYPQISGPFQKSLFNIEISGPDVVKSIKDEATSELASPGTFKILVPKVHNDPLTNEEVVLSLVPQLPVRLKPYMLARKYLIYSYYGEVNPSLGLIIDIGEESKEEVKSIFLAWENRLGILNDLKELFLVDIPKKTANDFKETTNAGAEIRYFTYSGEEAAITYAFFGQYLIMSSSLESINSAISHLQGTTEPIYP